MTGKKVAFGLKPSSKPPVASNAEDWVKNRDEFAEEESMKRLTLDIPESLHRKIKITCAGRGSKMVEEIRSLLESHYSKQGN